MEVRQTTFEAIGTHWEVQVTEAVTDEAWSQLLEQMQQRIEEFDRAYSRFRADSLVTTMAQKAGQYALPEDGYTLLQLYKKLYAGTGGKVTPLIGQALADAGYDATYSFTSQPLRQPPAWEDVLSYDMQHITLQQPALLDFGAAGKGYLVDIVGELIGQTGVRSYRINAGGDMLHRSATKEKIEVGLENPVDTSEAIGVVTLCNQSLCASAGSKRQWQNFHHIIDPKTLQSTEEIIATWVLADDTMTADGLATALFFTDAPKLLEHFTFSYAVLDKNMGLSYAKDFPIKLFETR